MQTRLKAKPPVGAIFDTDLGSAIDDALALALLYGLDAKNETRVISVSVSNSDLRAAAFCEVVGRFYAGAVSSDFDSLGRMLPVGLADGADQLGDSPMLSVPLAMKTAEGKPVFEHGIEKVTDTADAVAVIRTALTAQHDQNAVVILAGPAGNLARVLALPGSKDLIWQKVRFLSVMGGAYPSGDPEYNIKADIAAAKKVFAEWPTPIVASGYEVGNELLYPAASIEADFGWAPHHPIADAYRAYKPMPYDTPTWDLTAVLYAIRPNETYFKLSEPGTITVLDDGRTKFTTSAGGRHRYLIIDPDQKDRIVKTYRDLASTRPVVRQRRRPPAEQEEKEPPAKPAPVQ